MNSEPLINYDLVTACFMLIEVVLAIQILRSDKLIFKIFFIGIAIAWFGTDFF